MTTPTDTAKLADEIERRHARIASLRSVESTSCASWEIDAETNTLLAVLRVNTTAIIAALRELEAVKAREAKLREALEPFADLLEPNDENRPDGWGGSVFLTLGVLRRARAALGVAG